MSSLNVGTINFFELCYRLANKRGACRSEIVLSKVICEIWLFYLHNNEEILISSRSAVRSLLNLAKLESESLAVMNISSSMVLSKICLMDPYLIKVDSSLLRFSISNVLSIVNDFYVVIKRLRLRFKTRFFL